jgi:dienelactone hydrolase
VSVKRETVTFPTYNPVVLNDMKAPGISAKQIDGTGLLFLPEDAAHAPRPAVVVLEGLAGLKDVREIGYAEHLAGQGYVALAVDTFGARNAGANENWRALTVTESMMLADAYAALRFLRAHPAVDPDRIAVMGFSYGGMITVLAAYEQMRRLFAVEDERFVGHVSYYGCSVPRLVDSTATGAPVKIMLGERDLNVSVTRTHEIADDLRKGGADVDVIVYEGVYHQWDSRDTTKRAVTFSLCNVNMIIGADGAMRDESTGIVVTNRLKRAIALACNVSWGGYHMLADDAATEASTRELHAFLDRVFHPSAAAADLRPRARA